MGFSCEAVRRWAKEMYAEFFGSLTSLEDATDKWSWSLHEVNTLNGFPFLTMLTQTSPTIGRMVLNKVLKKKSLGQFIMVSDFVEEVGGLLEC